jgi:hypothetical protein
LLQHQPLRLSLPGLTGLEIGFDNPERTPAYTFERIQPAAAERKVALMWHGYELPPAAQTVPTGLAYIVRHKGKGIDLESARAELAEVRGFFAEGRHEIEHAAVT